MEPSYKGISDKIDSGGDPTRDEVAGLLENLSTEELCAFAHSLRVRFQGLHIDTCSIMNARSGRCSEDCKWCSQSGHYKTETDIYPLVEADAILAEALHNQSKGVARFSLVTSGRGMTYSEIEKVCGIYGQLQKETSMKLCASMGLLDREQLRKLRQSGVTRYHCNLETAPSFFPQVCTTHTIEQKLQTISWAREAGLEVCSGGIIGMGESEAQRVEFAFALRDAGVVSIPVNVLNPIQGTPLESMEPLAGDRILRAFAIMRIVNPRADIRFAGGRSVIEPLQEKLLYCGVSAAIVGEMLTTVGSDIDTDKEMFRRCGFEVKNSNSFLNHKNPIKIKYYE